MYFLGRQHLKFWKYLLCFTYLRICETYSMSPSVRVAILDDHQSIIDGYIFRLSQTPKIQVVATARFGQDLDSLLAKNSVDVLILDVQVATSEDSSSPYPILHVIPN